jgi:hypothetical protein
MKLKSVLTLAVMSVVAAIFAAEPAPVMPQETKEQHDARMAWWREAKFGLFIPFPPAITTASLFLALASGS